MRQLVCFAVLVLNSACASVHQGSFPRFVMPDLPAASTLGEPAQTRAHDTVQPVIVPFETPTFELTAHRKNYFLIASHDSRLPDLPSPSQDGENKSTEVKFQISLRYPFAKTQDGRSRMVVAYTATSHWQLYDFPGSAPFRTVDQEPEIFYERDHPDERVQWRAGINHNSNGESGLDSRSWNRVFGEIIFFDPDGFAWTPARSFHIKEGDDAHAEGELIWKGSLRVWEKFMVDDDNNGDISAFFGYFEARGDWFWATPAQPHMALMVRNNGRVHGNNRGATELQYSWRIVEGVRGLVQYFNGYGESLLDYNLSANRIGVGFELSP